MKKTLFLAIAVSAVITGCVRNETTNGNVVSDSKISFEAPAIAGITRGANVAGEISSPYPTTENFSVYARYFAGNYTTFAEGTSYMENIKTAYDNAGNYWDSEAAGGQAYYWPKNGTLTFAAYSPSGAAEDCTTVAWGANGFSFTDFSVKADPAKHYDLMFSERSYNRNASTGGTTYNGVDITFKHALSSVVYKVKASAEYKGHTITVTSIKLVNTFQTGTFNQNLADANDAMTTDAAAWSGQSNENADGYEAVTQNQALTSTATALTNQNPIIVLPQLLAHAGGNNVKIEVAYTINNGLATVEQSSTVDISDGYNITEFEMGKRYTFNLSFGLDKITFSPEVDDWVDENVTPDINL